MTATRYHPNPARAAALKQLAADLDAAGLIPPLRRELAEVADPAGRIRALIRTVTGTGRPSLIVLPPAGRSVMLRAAHLPERSCHLPRAATVGATDPTAPNPISRGTTRGRKAGYAR